MNDHTNPQPKDQRADTTSNQPTAARSESHNRHMLTERAASTATRVARRYRPLAIERLKRQGFTQKQAEQWTPLDSNAFWTRNDLVKIACAYREAGFDVIRARDWTRLDVQPPEASRFERAGWAPYDIWTLWRTLHAVRHPDRRTCPELGPCDSDADEWVETEIPAHLVPLYIRAGHTPIIAEQIDIRRRAGDTAIVPALTVMAALNNPVQIERGRADHMTPTEEA